MQIYHRKLERYWTTAHVFIEMLLDFVILFGAVLGVAIGLALFA